MLYFAFQDPPVKPTAGKICVFNPNRTSTYRELSVTGILAALYLTS